MRIVFFGTPDFGIPSLEKILSSKHQVLAVVSQPDRPRSRGIVTFSPIKKKAVEKGIPIFQFESIRAEGVDVLRDLNADLGITAAYGQILSQEIIDVFPKGIYNIHASLLPKYRGSSPIHRAIMNGEMQTGITIMRTDVGVDTGDIILSESVPIGENVTTGELYSTLSFLGAELILKAIDQTERGIVEFIPQNHAESTKCEMLSSSTGAIDWNNSAKAIHNLIRGLNPFPTAFAELNGERIRIFRSIVRDDVFSNAESGTILICDPKKGLVIKCGESALEILELQRAGKRVMDAKTFLLGNHLVEGARFQNGKLN